MRNFGILHIFNGFMVGDFTKHLYSEGCQQGKQKI